FFPGFVTAASDQGRDWGVHHYGLYGHMADKEEDNESVGALLGRDEISTFPSGELVAPLLDGLVTGDDRHLVMNLPNTGQVGNVDDGVVVECIGISGAGGLRPRDKATVPGLLGEQLHRVARAEELTVEAALTGDRTTLLDAMFTDPMAGRLPYEHVVR